jgi:hypothetical protein
MTQKQANDILSQKYPQGYIRYIDLGRKSNTNRIVVVTFTAHGKDYRYDGGFESVLVRLGCMEATPAPERTYNLEDNIFFQKNWK